MTKPARLSLVNSEAVQPPKKAARVRSSEAALDKALKAVKANGLTVEKLCISGGRYELHFGGVAEPKSAEKHGGLKEWE